MAIVTEHPKSGDGNRTGPDGDDVTRTFIVQIDTVGDSPIAEVETQTVPNGAPHHTARFRHLLATTYTQIVTESRKAWHVIVRYSQPSLFSWLLDVDLGTETELAKRSLPKLDRDGNVIKQGVLIGPRVYIPLKEGQTAHTHYTWTTRGKDRLLLKLAGDPEDPIGQVVKPTGLERLTARTSFTLSKRLRTLTRGNIADIMNGRAVVNNDEFAFQPPGTVLLLAISVREREGSVDGRADGRQTGLIYDTTAHFGVNKNGWTPERVFDVHTDEDGFEAAVIALGTSQGIADQPAFQDYDQYDVESLNALMTRLDSTWTPFAPLAAMRRIGGVRLIG